MVHLARPAALGAGDVKLSGSVGAALAAAGWPAMVLAAALAALLTLLLGLAPRYRRDGIPHGPGLLAATFLLTTVPTARRSSTLIGYHAPVRASTPDRPDHRQARIRLA